MHIAVKDLPDSLQRALDAAGFHKTDVEIEARQSVDPRGGGGNGVRGGLMAVNMATGEISRVVWGAWGGSNMFAENAIDDGPSQEIGANGAIIRIWQGGGRPTMATVYVRPETLTPMLPAAPTLTDRARAILAVYKSIRGGHRAEYLPGVAPAEIDDLVSGGFLKRNKAGSIRISTAGKNSAGSDYFVFQREEMEKFRATL